MGEFSLSDLHSIDEREELIRDNTRKLYMATTRAGAKTCSDVCRRITTGVEDRLWTGYWLSKLLQQHGFDLIF